MNNSNKVVVSMMKYVWILYFLKRDPRVNWKAKLVVLITLAYALSPIDLIPDFIPILGLLDDLIIIPLGIYLAIKLIPQEVWNDCNRLAEIAIDKGDLLPKNWVVASIIVCLWVIIIALIAKWLWHFFLS
ncbi:hypothetical protein BN59_03816 [Legionella massiliensis]|uniref:DUF1232 domain-containing protein n=1 Tax=Legionella massiliensis TaxID=1034943 RepID=A0A078L6G8_9GAMM|nr:hypothetical protein BN59_03816 [Legionella massiliensis]CEE15236.1 hypothetical protein BN1094_03816 [Legionella massiliensis]